MAYDSSIEWTETTWNPVTGCTPVSEGCANCYAKRMAKRLKAAGNPRYRNGFDVTLHHDLLRKPLDWKKSRMIFTNSMSDLFHKNVPPLFILEAFITMTQARQHIFQVLTKRDVRLFEMSPDLPWASNIGMGVTVESERALKRVNRLKAVPAAVKFLSIEPLLTPLPKLDVTGIDWVIVGGESGPGARPMQKEWVRDIRDKCLKQGVPFFFKQWGGVNKKKTGRLLDGRVWDEMPGKWAK